MTVQERSPTFTRRKSSSDTSHGGASGARSNRYDTIPSESVENSTSPAPIQEKPSAKRPTTRSTSLPE